MTQSLENPNPDARVVDENDDVATTMRAFAAGEKVVIGPVGKTRTVSLRESVPAGHKFSLRPLAEGVRVRKYGEVIGAMTADVPEGVWIHVHNMVTTERQDLSDVASLRRTPAREDRGGASRADLAFDGFRRLDGRVGVRNHVLVLSPTGLTSAAARRIAASVLGCICVATGYGRGQVGEDARLQFDTMAGLARHPNVAAVLVVAADDDIARPYVDVAIASGRPAVGLSLPGVNEDALTLVDAGVRTAIRLVHAASKLRRERCSLADLCIAVECGHSDATSGLVSNPLAGRMVDVIVDGGGRAMFSETVEWTGAEHLLAQRAVTNAVAQRVVDAVQARERRVRDAGGDVRVQNPGPQNKVGGITTIEEKALGAIAKGGSRPIRGVLRAAQQPQESGLFLMDTPYFSPESMTAMVASGAQIVIFTTGPGNSYCSLVAPTMKMSANARTCDHLVEQMDFIAARVETSAGSEDQLLDAAIGHLLDIASGSATFGEIVGEGDEVISRLGASI